MIGACTVLFPRVVLLSAALDPGVARARPAGTAALLGLTDVDALTAAVSRSRSGVTRSGAAVGLGSWLFQGVNYKRMAGESLLILHTQYSNGWTTPAGVTCASRSCATGAKSPPNSAWRSLGA